MKEEGQESKVRAHRLFLDDLEYQAFTRRLSWSPDGSVLLTPASCYFDLKLQQKPTNYNYTVYAFSKHNLQQPAFMLPGIKSYATCVRFSPYLYKLTKTSEMLDLPY